LLDEPTRSLDPIAAARMRATIQSLAQRDEQRVTIFLTSHNLAEVEELCNRVAIIGKGRIRAIDSPANLRAMHTPEEQHSIEFTSRAPADAEQALRLAFSERFFTLERTSEVRQWKLRFSRESGDETLDSVLRVLQQSGAVIRSVETEKPTLLDVLERYEEDGSGR